jgi:hypothetical protein
MIEQKDLLTNSDFKVEMINASRLEPSLSISNKHESYLKTRGNFQDQDATILECLEQGLNNCWDIHYHTRMLITSIRRSLTTLSTKGIIREDGRVFNPNTRRFVTTYAIVKSE